MTLLFFLLMALALGLHVGDYVVTMKSITEFGAKEANPVMRFLFNKLGMPVTTFLGAAAVLVIGCVFASQGPEYGAAYAGITSVGEAVVLIRGYLLYKKLKVKK